MGLRVGVAQTYYMILFAFADFTHCRKANVELHELTSRAVLSLTVFFALLSCFAGRGNHPG